MTDREKLIALQKSNCVPGKKCPGGCLECMTDHLIANGVRLERKQSIGNNASDESKRWIPVTERLPETDTRVLAYRKEHSGDHLIAWAKYCKNGWFDMEWNCQRYGITHWMPLPEPPKGERA